MKRWLVAGLLATLVVIPKLATAQDQEQETREVFVRVQFNCLFEPDQQQESFPRTVRNPRPGRPESFQVYFNPPCDGPIRDVTLHDAVSGAQLNRDAPIFEPATFFTIGTAGCSRPDCPGSLQVDVTLRNDATADLRLHLRPTTGSHFASVDAVLAIEAEVFNRGPEDADEVSLRLAFPPGVRAAPGSRPPCVRGLGRRLLCGPFTVPVHDDELGIGTSAFIRVIPTVPGARVAFSGTVESASTRDPVPEDNTDSLELAVTGSPESTVEVLPDGAEGTAESFFVPPAEGVPVAEVMSHSAARVSPRIRRLSRLKRVEIAVLRRTGRRGQCLWLASRRGQFRPRAPLTNGKCDRGRWLRAKGVARWRFKLTRRWPAGRYTLYSRAVNRAGVRETGFSRRERNLVNFTIRR